MVRFKVTFLPSEQVFVAESGETLLECAMKAGIHINASCGGTGSCGKCRVKVLTGEADVPRHQKVSEEEHGAGVRLACRTGVEGDLIVEIPFESKVDRQALRGRRPSSHILSAADLGELVKGLQIDPVVFKRYLELPIPTAEDNLSDMSRLVRELKRSHGITDVSANLEVLKRLPSILRESGWKVTATVARAGGGHLLVNLEPGDRTAPNYAVAIDVGTTTVCAQLLDLAHCTPLRIMKKSSDGRDLCTVAELSDFNAQISYGEDVISRIVYTKKKGGLERLQKKLIGTVNGLIGELSGMTGVSREEITLAVLAGNTTMTHLALGLDPKYLMLAPYTPVAASAPPVKARDLGMDLGAETYLYVFPCVASYVGGDIVAGVLGSGVFQKEGVTLFMDIGTNGEIVLGNRDWLMCCSCSAGPAFEGGGITFGTRATEGAIEQARINPATGDPMILTIGRTKPVGICGSGLIDLVAGLIEAGLIDQNGRFRKGTSSKRVREGETGAEYVISYAPETAINRDIVLNEADLDNLLRAKAAMYAGCKVLLDHSGLSFGDLDRVILAGGFGHYLDIERAQTIGLLPDLPAEKFLFVGNGSLLGARLVSFSRGFLAEAERIAGMMTNIELSTSARFMDEFVAAMFIPHTDQGAFPTVMERLRGNGAVK
jgi:uncharacterized 2Fe-2S/4Fe-4S cluster protein (DUF4445 family)